MSDPDGPGVGPWQGPLPDGEHWDPELLVNGDHRNVVDRYRYWSVEAIVADLDTRRAPLQIAIENWQHDLNIGSVVRTANAFNVSGVHIVGRRRWNRRGAMVTDRYLSIHHHEDPAALAAWAAEAEMTMIGIDIFPESTPLETAVLPRRSLLVFGQEGPGISQPMREQCTAMLSIAQSGSTRSINAAAAAAIAMHSWLRQHPS